MYKSANITLEGAVKNKSKVKVLTAKNEIYKFSRLESERGKLKHTALNENTILSINEENRTMSSISTFGIFIGSILGGIVVAYFIETGGGL